VLLLCISRAGSIGDEDAAIREAAYLVVLSQGLSQPKKVVLARPRICPGVGDLYGGTLLSDRIMSLHISRLIPNKTPRKLEVLTSVF
jgi:hypothetical protein